MAGGHISIGEDAGDDLALGGKGGVIHVMGSTSQNAGHDIQIIQRIRHHLTALCIICIFSSPMVFFIMGNSFSLNILSSSFGFESP